MSTPFTVGVLGAGHVGAAVTNALVLLGACRRVVLFDRHLERAEGKAWDIEDGVPLLEEVDIVPTSSYADLATADVVVVTVGQSKIHGSRLELLGGNAGITVEVIDQLDQVAPDAVVIMATNPVDVLTRIAMDTPSGHHSSSSEPEPCWKPRAFRTGWVAPSRSTRGTSTPTSSGSTARVPSPLWSSAEVGSVKLEDFPLPNGEPVSTVQDDLGQYVLARAFEIIKRKGYTSQGLAAAVASIVHCVRRDQKQVLVVSSRPRPEYGIGDVVLGLPCVVGGSGVERQLLLSLTADEQERLRQSAVILDGAYRSIPVPP